MDCQSDPVLARMDLHRSAQVGAFHGPYGALQLNQGPQHADSVYLWHSVCTDHMGISYPSQVGTPSVSSAAPAVGSQPVGWARNSFRELAFSAVGYRRTAVGWLVQQSRTGVGWRPSRAGG